MTLDIGFLLYVLAATLVGIVASARVTRLFTQDVYPPVARLRAGWGNLVHRKGWNEDWEKLANCPYCASAWITLVNLGWALLSVHLTGALDPVWWIVNGWFAAMYLVAMVVVRDGE